MTTTRRAVSWRMWCACAKISRKKCASNNLSYYKSNCAHARRLVVLHYAYVCRNYNQPRERRKNACAQQVDDLARAQTERRYNNNKQKYQKYAANGERKCAKLLADCQRIGSNKQAAEAVDV